jgi:hypothetical protein
LDAQRAREGSPASIQTGALGGTGPCGLLPTHGPAAAGHLQALPGTVVPEQFTGRDTAPAWLDVERVMAADTGRDQAALLISLARSELEATKYAYSLPGGATF